MILGVRHYSLKRNVAAGKGKDVESSEDVKMQPVESSEGTGPDEPAEKAAALGSEQTGAANEGAVQAGPVAKG